MCQPKAPQITAAAPIIAAPNGNEASRQASLENALRRRRAGAAATVLTSARGIPTNTKLGAAA